jgi:SAM-dependent methyltransferase
LFVEAEPLEYAQEDGRGFLSPEAAAEAARTDFRLRLCRACGFQWTTPQHDPSALSELYAGTGTEYFEPLAEASADRRRVYQTVKSRLRQQDVVTGRLLDLGCGTGEALREFRGTYELYGVEPSPFAAAHAREAAGARVHEGDLQSAGFPSQFFDVVTAFDVVEHLTEPMATLRELYRILRPGGLVFIETGDIESLTARLAGAHWYYVLLPGHLSFFSRRTLTAALGETGFVDMSFSRTHHGFIDLPYLGGLARVASRHLLIRLFGKRVLAMPVFRSRTTKYRIPFFFDHMLVSGRVRQVNGVGYPSGGVSAGPSGAPGTKEAG